jgi:hypothetical protein
MYTDHWSYHFSYSGIVVPAFLTAVGLWKSKYAVKRMFKTAPNGERLFYLRGEPYIVPDAATERHLYRKASWLLRFFVASPLFGILCMHYLVEDSLLVLLGFLAVWALGSLGLWLARRLLFASNLRDLRRAEA